MRNTVKIASIGAAITATLAISTTPASAASYTHTRLENVWSYKCLGTGSEKGSGAQLIQWTCDGSRDLRWTITPTSGGYYTIKNDWSGKCMAVAGSAYGNGAKVIQWDCKGYEDQKWALSGSEIINAHSGKSVGVGSSKANGAGAIQWTKGAGYDQLWGLS
ncbi:RICIN domain-containing protein [Streptomyces sp. NPDC018019]|uniref:RICIN domain-containing protein n=1 Tax=Streptomyces sp. NPDC018019 TaxID=3365030 RepID=UPI0037A10855